jgi:acetolactate synthase-1/2/3 large subunit
MSSLAENALTDTLFADPAPGGQPTSSTVLQALRGPDGDFEPLLCARLFSAGTDSARQTIAGALQRLTEDAPGAQTGDATDLMAEILSAGVVLSGAQVLSVLLARAGVEQVFAYGGTSELPLCDAVDNLPGITLINGRGDKESAFMAAGASLLRPLAGAAILHGARGLTNAGGALADSRRNEAGCVFVVGLASTGSSRFDPPHGERGLLSTMGHFARWTWEAPALPDDVDQRVAAAETYVDKAKEAISRAARQPWGPVLFGVPQDVAEAAWIPLEVFVSRASGPLRTGAQVCGPDEAVVRFLREARRPVVLVDDYALRSPGIRPALDRFSKRAGAVVVQLRYRRGLMLFERLQPGEVENFVGWLNPYSKAHRTLLEECDLLITLEDRNIYKRVVGDLPPCRKVAVNTDPQKVHKNEYLQDGDVLIQGDPAVVLDRLANELPGDGPAEPYAWAWSDLRRESMLNPEPPSQAVHDARGRLAGAVADLLHSWARPVLVDDSSMFGGLLNEHYDQLPTGLRVFGGHGGFVGAGLGYAIGSAIAEPGHQVLCTLGDQAFTNSYQALVTAVEQQTDLLILVCNNGQSVSLNKQGAASYGNVPRRYLDNAAGFDYTKVAQALGLHAERVSVPVGGPEDEVAAGVASLAAALRRGAAWSGPALVELVLPADPEAWRGIWVVHGFEQAAGGLA